MITKYYKTTKDTELIEKEDFRRGCWINVENTTETDLQNICTLTGLSIDDLRDSLDDYEVPRLERQGENIIIFIRTPEPGAKDLFTETLTIVINKNYIITISAEENEIINAIKSSKLKISTTQRSKFLLYILIKTANAFTKSVKGIANEVRHSKRKLENIENNDILKLVEREEILNQFMAALIPMRNVFENIISGDYVYLYDEDSNFLHDMLISIKQSVDVCTVNIKSIASLRDSFQIVFTNRLNKTIKLLTSFTIILTIPTLVSSVYGMNVDLPFSGSPFAFPIVMFIAVGISSIILIYFYIKKWF